MIKRFTSILKIGSVFLAVMLVLSNVGCNGHPSTLKPMIATTSMPPIETATLVSSATQPPEATTPSPAYPPTPTPIPDSWLTYTNPAFPVEFHFPENWQPETPTRYSGPDGYFELTTQSFPASEFDSFSTLCVLEANEKKPAVYGASPYISDWQSWNPQLEIWAGFGCTVTPDSDKQATPRDQAVLLARYPEPWPRNTLLVLRADSAHFNSILNTLQFTDFVTPTPHPINYYNSPACNIPPANQNVKISYFAGLTITEYPLVNADCDPMNQFDGFQARVPALNPDDWARYDADRLRRAEQANRLLEPFGYRLVGRQVDLGGANPVLASRKTTVFDLYHGDEVLTTDINQIGPVTISASGDDFILWVEDTDNLAATEVRRDSLRTLNWWESGFNTAWVGSDLVRYELAKDPLFPIGAPSQAIVYRNDKVIYTLTIPQPGPAGDPVQWLWAWQGHWVLEVENVVVQDGELQNPKLGYAEMFAWHLVNDKPFYFFSKGGAFGLSYAGQTLPQRYEDIIHGLLCCDSAAYSLDSSSAGAWFYALKDKVWYLVSVLAE